MRRGAHRRYLSCTHLTLKALDSWLALRDILGQMVETRNSVNGKIENIRPPP